MTLDLIVRVVIVFNTKVMGHGSQTMDHGSPFSLVTVSVGRGSRLFAPVCKNLMR